jgi:hypothetical protein
VLLAVKSKLHKTTEVSLSQQTRNKSKKEKLTEYQTNNNRSKRRHSFGKSEEYIVKSSIVKKYIYYKPHCY